MSAELIRSDRQLMELFSEEFPGLNTCRSNDPVYVYGPRGCGKSTVFRALSLRTILQSARPLEELRKVPFIGVYVSCTSELRSRFWLLPKDKYDDLEAYIVKFFNLILMEELANTLDAMANWDLNEESEFQFGIGPNNGADIAMAFRQRIGIERNIGEYGGLSPFGQLRGEIRQERDRIWTRILEGNKSSEHTNAQLLFDLCADIGRRCPIFEERRITFLLDDYSNQRIPNELQSRLNQAITFAKQGNPTFKVTSEYEGVDLTGIPGRPGSSGG